jgi:hypothetical protein
MAQVFKHFLSAPRIHSLLKKSVISGSVQSTAPMNFRRVTPLRSMMKVSGQP